MWGAMKQQFSRVLSRVADGRKHSLVRVCPRNTIRHIRPQHHPHRVVMLLDDEAILPTRKLLDNSPVQSHVGLAHMVKLGHFAFGIRWYAGT
jgi:hypothetical protein